MKYDRRIATILLLVLAVAMLINSFYVTPPVISDTDPSTYVVVPMLMLPLFLLFTMKKRFEPQPTNRDVWIGAALFAVLFVTTLVLRFAASYLFLSFRLDMLLFPLAIASLVTLLFGFKNLHNFKGAMIYSVLASPAVLVYLINQNQGFVELNSTIVYDIVKQFVHSLVFLPPYSMEANGIIIGIGQACVGIGALIGIMLFLIPVAFLYDGKLSRKAVWVLSGFVLLLALNLVRMLSITYAWITNPQQIILTIHIFAGILIFYISIIAIVVLAGRYGLGFPRPRSRQKKKGMAHAAFPTWPVIIAIVIAAIYFVLAIDYAGALTISPLALVNSVPFNTTVSPALVEHVTSLSGYTSITLANNNGSRVAVLLSNATVNESRPILVYLGRPNESVEAGMLANATVTGGIAFLNAHGDSDYVSDIYTGGQEFFVYHTIVPETLSNASSTLISTYVLLPSYTVGRNQTCAYDPIITPLLNALNPNYYSASERGRLVTAYCEASYILGS